MYGTPFAFWRRALYKFTGKLPVRIIDHKGEPYLERYFLFKKFGLCAYIHRFVDSDPGRGLHDHPWPWAVSLVLSGFYIEERVPEGEVVVVPLEGGDGLVSPHPMPVQDRIVSLFNFLRGGDFHRVNVVADCPSAWTLFIHRDKKHKTWGFADPESGTYRVFSYSETDPQHLYGWWLRNPKGRDEPRRLLEMEDLE